MMNFEQARKNMVDCQIHTNGVIDKRILNAFETVPREKFVPSRLQNTAFNDEDLRVAEGRYLLEPSVHARLIQALDLKPESVVLDIGGGTGYSAAILSSIASTVVVVESEQSYLDRLAETLDELDIRNVATFTADLHEGSPDHAPYDSIIINGAVAEVPQTILDQLAPEGRLVCVVKQAGKPIGAGTLYQKAENGSVSSYPLFDAATPYLEGFEPRATFNF
ncbi:MAG: protein-L-isoaspartate O-methyltransferase [Alphaproteobacteria bacterium]|nr:protein-L-isoaspartate O-methyltransferase [Alphaproteobacteria bacterium]